MKGAASDIRGQPVAVVQHVPGGTDVDGVLALPWVATEETGHHIKGQYGGKNPARWWQAYATAQCFAGQREKIRHLGQK